jgi:phosphoglycolate phosphatase
MVTEKLLRTPRMLLIDLDGTLVDSVPDLAYCVDGTLQALGMPSAGEAAVRNWVGNGVERLLRRALTGQMEGEPEEGLINRARPLFMALYEKNISVRSRVYAGVREGLEDFRKRAFRLGCVTNKAARFTEPLLRDLGLDHYFEIVVSGDSLPQQKPHPMPLLHAAEQLGVDCQDALMVGDSRSDVKAARAAGFQVVCVTYGYNHGEDIRTYRPDAVIDALDEIPALFAQAA